MMAKLIFPLVMILVIILPSAVAAFIYDLTLLKFSFLAFVALTTTGLLITNPISFSAGQISGYFSISGIVILAILSISIVFFYFYKFHINRRIIMNLSWPESIDKRDLIRHTRRYLLIKGWKIKPWRAQNISDLAAMKDGITMEMRFLSRNLKTFYKESVIINNLISELASTKRSIGYKLKDNFFIAISDFELARSSATALESEGFLCINYKHLDILNELIPPQFCEDIQFTPLQLNILENHSSFCASLSKYLLEKGNIPEAIKWANNAIEKNKFDVDNYMLLVYIYVKNGDLESAKHTLTNALKANPNDPRLRARMQEICYRTGSAFE